MAVRKSMRRGSVIASIVTGVLLVCLVLSIHDVVVRAPANILPSTVFGLAFTVAVCLILSFWQTRCDSDEYPDNSMSPSLPGDAVTRLSRVRHWTQCVFCAVFALTVVYPPWQARVHERDWVSVKQIGHAFILSASTLLDDEASTTPSRKFRRASDGATLGSDRRHAPEDVVVSVNSGRLVLYIMALFITWGTIDGTVDLVMVSIRNARRRSGRCPTCGYNLRGRNDASQCPECGRCAAACA